MFKTALALLVLIISMPAFTQDYVIDSADCNHKVDQPSKMKGVTVSIKLPCSWNFRETTDSKQLAIFSDQSHPDVSIIGGLGYSDIVFSKSEIPLLLSDEELRETARRSGTYIKGKRISIDGQAAGEIVTRMKTVVQGVTVYTYKINNYIYTERGAVFLFYTVQAFDEDLAEKSFNSSLKKLRAMAVSTVISW